MDFCCVSNIIKALLLCIRGSYREINHSCFWLFTCHFSNFFNSVLHCLTNTLLIYTGGLHHLDMGLLTGEKNGARDSQNDSPLKYKKTLLHKAIRIIVVTPVDLLTSFNNILQLLRKLFSFLLLYCPTPYCRSN